MTIEDPIAITIRCDARHCKAFQTFYVTMGQLDHPHNSARQQAHMQAKVRGWCFQGHKSYCPTCSGERKGAPK
jgi:hypothetical protein